MKAVTAPGWKNVTKSKLAEARAHQERQPHPLNRRAVRYWTAHHWWAVWGRYVSAVIGASVGAAIALAVLAFWGSR